MAISEHSKKLTDVAQQIRDANTATKELLSTIADTFCRRLSIPSQRQNVLTLKRLIEVGAFTQAALAIVEFELPQWKLRRLTYDEGFWHCALSRQRELPDWLDQAVDTHHADMSLAIVSAYLETLRQTEPETSLSQPLVPQMKFRPYHSVSCENFR